MEDKYLNAEDLQELKVYIDTQDLNSANVFVATYEQTTYADVKQAIDDKKVIVLKMPNNNNLFVTTYNTYTNGGNVTLQAIYDVLGTNNPALFTATLTPQNAWSVNNARLQNLLVSGTSIKTINNESLLGSGNIDVGGGGATELFFVTPNTTTYAELKQAILDNKVIAYKQVSSMIYVSTFSGFNSGEAWFTVVTGAGNAKSWSVNNANVWESSETIINRQATDSTLGLVKTNSAQNVTLNADGQLVVGGRLGQTAEGGLYNPTSMTPTKVEANALLLSGMSGLSVANGALALLRGSNVTVKSAPPGTTEYHVSNTYTNRLAVAGLQSPGSVCIINEAAESTGEFSKILSCKINGAAFTPNSSGTDSSNDIIITVDKTCNPSSTITAIRCYPPATKSSSFYAGQMVGGESGLANVVVGQQCFTKSGNVVAMVAAQSYNAGNGNAIFGRYHNVNKNRWFVSGTGHDTTSGRSEAGAVVGAYSDIKSDTMFAVGNGSDQLNRSNAFEVTSDGTAKSNAIKSNDIKSNAIEVTSDNGIVLKSPNGTRYKVTVDNSGNLTTTAI